MYAIRSYYAFSVNQSIDSQFSDKLVGLKEQSVIVKDSLFALANRNPTISNKIYSEINQLDFSFDKVFFFIGEVNVGNSLRYLQTGITAVNRITSYNVCYTKLLRNNKNLSMSFIVEYFYN